MDEVGIVDYGAGNIASVAKAIYYAGGNPVSVATPEDILSCERLVLPGVGAAGQALANLRAANLHEALTEAVIEKGTPFLGICLGLQLLAERLYEYGEHEGLGWIKGEVVHLSKMGVENLPIPHMGWNEVVFTPAGYEIAQQLGKHNKFYFAHSYALRTEEKEKIAAKVFYGMEFTVGVAFDNIWAMQFHPEKSQVAGDLFMQAFLGRT